jgi:hypothetical protein
LARIDGLVAEQRALEQQQQKAAERLAALEEERNRQRRADEERQRAEQARQEALRKCKGEGVELASIESDLAQLRLFAKRTTCDDVRALTNAKIAAIEREEKTCRDEDGRRNSLLTQAKRLSDRIRLTGAKDDLVELERGMTCLRLRPSVVATTSTVRVKIAQIELKRVGCYTGGADGTLNDATRDAAKVFLARLSRPDSDGSIDEELLSELKSQNGPICKPPAVAERTPPSPKAKKKQPDRPSPAAPAPAARPGPAHGPVLGVGG